MARKLKKATIERFHALMLGGVYAFGAEPIGPDDAGDGFARGKAEVMTKAGRLCVSWGGDYSLHVHSQFIDAPNQYVWRNCRNEPHPHGDRLAVLKAEGLVPSCLNNTSKWNHYYGDNADFGAADFLRQLAKYAGPADPRIAQWQADDFQLEFPGAAAGDWLLWSDNQSACGWSAAQMTHRGLSFATVPSSTMAELLAATETGSRWVRVGGVAGDDTTLAKWRAAA